MKKIFTLMFAAIAAVTMNAKTAESGSCGDNLTWSFNSSTGTLKIAGTGAMTNYTVDNSAPWKAFNTQITKLDLEPGMTTIGDYAFYWLSSLKEADIPETVTSIGDYAFDLCSSMRYVWMSRGVQSIGKAAFGLCAFSELYLPYGLTSIGESAFGLCTKLVNVAIPSTVNTIGDYAFQYCTALKAIAYFASTPPTINANVFDGVNKSECKLYVPDYAQGNYNKPTWIEFNKETQPTVYTYSTYKLIFDFETGTLTVTGTGLLPDCEPIYMPFVTDYESQIFQLSLSPGLTGIGKYFFSYFIMLDSVAVPDGVVILKEGAFSKCYSLSSVTIPGSTVIIEDYVFENCYLLQTIYNYATVPQAINPNVFMGVDVTQCTLYVPKGCKAAYEAAAVWQDFIIEEMKGTEGVENVQSDKGQCTKVLRDGQLYIIRDNKVFNLQGAEVVNK